MKKLNECISKSVVKTLKSAVVLNVNSNCFGLAHQNKLPENAKKYRKF
ncbi:cyclic lactone autoinducer peptide [uncultured Tyzzerella sp.]|nr:cyclic lactone autoinducer peptide [uncultured Tyzzerella sp.]